MRGRAAPPHPGIYRVPPRAFYEHIRDRPKDGREGETECERLGASMRPPYSLNGLLLNN